MTVQATAPARLPVVQVLVLLAGFAVAVGLRVAVGGPGVSQSVPAGLLFAAALTGLSLAAGVRVPVSRAAVVTGLGGVVVVCLPVSVQRALEATPLQGTTGFVPWALAVTVVATSEEVFLRGALHDAVSGTSGPRTAVAVGAVAFALLHVPLYGWHVLPLDLAVGVVLGGLRVATGTAAAPAVTHVGADLVGWFVR